MNACPGLDEIVPGAWHGRPATEAARRSRRGPRAGLPAAEASRRLEQHGPNQLAGAPREPRWRPFLRQFQDLLILILLVAAAVSLAVTRQC